MSKGKRRRRREANFKEAHGLNRRPASPPRARKDEQCIPATLMRLIALKKTPLQGGKKRREGLSGRQDGISMDAGSTKAGSTSKINRDPTAAVNRKVARSQIVADPDGRHQLSKASDNSKGKGSGLSKKDPLDHRRREEEEEEDNESASVTKKKKKGPETLADILDMCRSDGGTNLTKKKRKRYLEEKKEKKKQQRRGEEKDDALRPLNVLEKIRFGDVAQAPPRLAFSQKAIAKKLRNQQEGVIDGGGVVKEADGSDVADAGRRPSSARHFSSQMGPQALSKERLREHMVQLYRKKKGWNSRPGSEILTRLQDSSEPTLAP